MPISMLLCNRSTLQWMEITLETRDPAEPYQLHPVSGSGAVARVHITAAGVLVCTLTVVRNYQLCQLPHLVSTINNSQHYLWLLCFKSISLPSLERGSNKSIFMQWPWNWCSENCCIVCSTLQWLEQETSLWAVTVCQCVISAELGSEGQGCMKAFHRHLPYTVSLGQVIHRYRSIQFLSGTWQWQCNDICNTELNKTLLVML